MADADVAEMQSLMLDISTTSAFVTLDRLFQEGKLTKEEMEDHKARYQRLHDQVIATYNSESALLNKAKELNNTYLQLKEKTSDKNKQTQEMEAKLRQQRTELANRSKELKDIEEQNNLIRFEVEELERQNQEKEVMIEQKRDSYMKMIQPQIDKLQADYDALEKEVEQNREAFAKEQQATDDYKRQLEEFKTNKQRMEKRKLMKKQELMRITNEPEAHRVKVGMLRQALERFDDEVERLKNEIVVRENDLADIHKERETLEGECSDYVYQLETIRVGIERSERQLLETQRALEAERDTAQLHEEEFSKVEWQRKEQSQLLRQEQHAYQGYHKECEKQKRRYEKLRRKRDTIVDILPPLIQQTDILKEEIAELESQTSAERQKLVEFKEEEDLFISKYLIEAQSEESTQTALQAVQEEGKELEDKLSKIEKEERALKQQLMDLETQRELMSRAASKATSAARETKEHVKVQDLVLLDLKKQAGQALSRLQAESKLYSIIKNHRNKIANASQALSQALAEMREKIKILSNEAEILRNESMSRDVVLAEEVRSHTSAKNQRDTLRVEHNKQLSNIREKKTQEEQQQIEMRKLNALVNKTEKEMIHLRKNYSAAVDSRNLCGIQLIDRNDELCILYEKSNIHKSILKKGQEAISAKIEKARYLSLELAELRRKIEVARKHLPSPVDYEEARKRLDILQKDLTEEKKTAKTLALQLESPDGPASDGKTMDLALLDDQKAADPVHMLSRSQTRRPRHRKLQATDPTADELNAKLETLQDRLNDKKEQLLEKELILDEVSTLSTKLGLQAASKRGDTLHLAQKINDYQSKIRTITRKMMATVSELSMYQANAMKLEQQRIQNENQLRDAQERLQQGLPPTDDAEHEWYRMERDRAQRQQAVYARKQELHHDTDEMSMDSKAGRPMHTTAELRPNAYIPDDLGIPKPYGGMAPFKPTPGGATMRHIRKPQPREVEI